MSYRDDVMSYTDECLEGIRFTLEEPRVEALSSEDLQEVHDNLRELASKALAAKKDKTLKTLD